MKQHIFYAHRYWELFIRPGDVVIDATVGNGHDTLFLASLLKGSGRLIGYDIQPKALEETQKRLEGLPENYISNITLKLESHALFSEPRVRLIVYNLGYLPGADKGCTTQTETTLASIKRGLELLAPGGALSITCYPGHPEGAKEEESIINFFKELPTGRYNFCHRRWIYPTSHNWRLSPSLIWLQDALCA